LARADDYEQVKAVAEYYIVCSMPLYILSLILFSTAVYNYFFFIQEYATLFEGAGNNPGEKTLEDRFFEHEVVFLLKDSFCTPT
jgi:V-type H+-transporting ATPase subunit d